MSRVAYFVILRQKPLLYGIGAVSLILVALVPTIQLNDEFVKYFDNRIEFRRDVDWATDHLTGVYTAEYSLPSQEEGGISEPEYLMNLEKFTEWLRQQPIVAHVYSYSDVIKRLNKNMNGDDDVFYKNSKQSRTCSAIFIAL